MFGALPRGRGIKQIITAVLTLVVLAAPAQEATPRYLDTASTAAVRMAYLVANEFSVDVLLDGQAVLRDVMAGTVSEYLLVPAGQRRLEFIAAGTGQAQAQQSSTLVPQSLVLKGTAP